MRNSIQPALLALLCLCGACAAMADNSVPIKITNNGTDDVIVSLYDMNTNPHSKLLSHQRISGFASIPISVSAGADGTAHVFWTAFTADPSTRKCSRKDKPGLANDASVHVYAKSECPAK